MKPTDTHSTPDAHAEPAGTRDLLELAVIDALGLLDGNDKAAFDAGLAAAPASLRELIREEQARMADISDLLPDVEPGPGLRERVLGLIGAEIDRAARPAAGQRRAVVHTAATSPTPRPPRLQRARRVHTGWRVAAVALSVAVVVLGVLQVQLRQQFTNVQGKAQISMLIDTIGAEHINTALFSAATDRFEFVPTELAPGRAQATLLVPPEAEHARLYIMNFPTTTPYKVVVLDDEDRPIRELTTFGADGLLSGVSIRLPDDGPMRLAIMTDEARPRLLLVADVNLA